MESFELDTKDAIVVGGVTSGFSFDNNGDQFLVLMVHGLTTKFDRKVVSLIIYPGDLAKFVRVVNSMENA